MNANVSSQDYTVVEVAITDVEGDTLEIAKESWECG